MRTLLARYPRLFLFAAATVLVAPAPVARDMVAAGAIDSVHISSISREVVRDLRRTTPLFLKAKKRYLITFEPGGPAFNYVVVAVEEGGWIGVVVSDIPQPEFITLNDPRDILWVNVSRAFTMKEVIPPER